MELKTVEEQLLDASESLKRRGVDFEINAKSSVEQQLEEANKLLETTPVRKRNGALDNNTPLAEVKEKDPMYARLVESFQSLGMTEKEARIAAMSDEQFAESNFQEQHGYLYNEK
jgi:hypothetical protein